MGRIKIVFIVFLISFLAGSGFSQSHPRLVLNKKGVSAIKSNLKKLPLLNQSLREAIEEVDKDMAAGIEVPVPKDMAGGYTHERHKKNYLILQKAGVIYQITGDQKYAVFIRDMLMQYAKLYPTLPLHPEKRSYARGKLFWQCLNDANWMVYMSQAYDCVYDWLKPEERKVLEQDLFRPYADFLSVGNPQFFNRIHNHSTWGIAAVGMIGFVMNDNELIDRALYGLKDDGIDKNQKDNDGGLIKLPGQPGAGFFIQLDYLFSPDGYYTEGPYYQRYALYPIMLFAESIENCRPDLKIFGYRDHILSKSLFAILNLTDSEGQFFPINDSQKGMSYLSRELVSAVDIIYHFGGKDPTLLSIAKMQNRVLLDNTGLSVAKGISEGREKPFVKKSIELTDGQNGEQGGVGIIRAGKPSDELCLVMKYGSQGMGHGHFDKLSFSMYDKGKEVLQDYGAARFVNIDQKYGGAYLPENTTWAKQSVAHNTLVVNETSHFKGDFETGNKYHSDSYFFNASGSDIQIMCAKDTNAYPGISMQRTMAVIEDKAFEKPLIIDVFRVQSQNENQYDIPYWFMGQVMNTDFEYSVPSTLSPLGKDFGYQHLWKTGEGKTGNKNAKLNWFANERFYTITTVVSPDDQLLFAQLGAKDPLFNLRRDQSFIIRKNKKSDAIYVSVIETNGHYDPVNEISANSFSNITDIDILVNTGQYTVVAFGDKTGKKWTLILVNEDGSSAAKHHFEAAGRIYDWVGPFKLTKQEYP
jgi:hypothetical protein